MEFSQIKGRNINTQQFLLEPPRKELSSFFESPDFLHRTINLGEKSNYRTPPLNTSGSSCITAKSALLCWAGGHPGTQGDVGAVPLSCRSTESPGCPAHGDSPGACWGCGLPECALVCNTTGGSSSAPLQQHRWKQVKPQLSPSVFLLIPSFLLLLHPFHSHSAHGEAAVADKYFMLN